MAGITSRRQPPLRTLKGGCIIVDSTRKGKRCPDSMSKTIPIWTCVLNRAILNYRSKMDIAVLPMEGESKTSDQIFSNSIQGSHGWDSSLHLPLWVTAAEKLAIEAHLDGWTKQLEASGADISSLASLLRKPLRPLWISQKTVIWLNEVPEHDSWDFTPIILVSASSSNDILPQRTSSAFSWNYIPGAGDDEESWARSLSPSLFWKNVYDIINSGPDLCNQKVADIVEKDRVYRSQRGQSAPQVSIKPPKLLGTIDCSYLKEPALDLRYPANENDVELVDGNCALSWLGSTNLAICATGYASKVSNIDSILNCDQEFACLETCETYLHLPIMNSKFDRFSLLRNLPSALNFAEGNLQKGRRLIICCNNGEDISVCVCLTAFTSLFNIEGIYDGGKSFKKTSITKLEMRQRLIFICKYVVNARPSRGNLRQVFNFLNGGSIDRTS